MVRKTTRQLLVILALCTCGCAGSYRPISPKSIQYAASAEDGDVELQYKYDVLDERGNRKYARKERNKSIKLVAVKVTNYGTEPLVFGEHIWLYAGGRQVLPMEPIVVWRELKQPTPLYLLYLLLTPVNLYVTSNGQTDIFPVGFILGPGLTLGNVLVAGSANQKFQNELFRYNLTGKIIGPDQTVYGIIGMRDVGYYPMSIEVVR